MSPDQQHPTPPGRTFVSVGQAARIAKVTRDGIDRAMRDGRLRVYRDTGGRRSALLDDVLEFKRHLWETP